MPPGWALVRRLNAVARRFDPRAAAIALLVVFMLLPGVASAQTAPAQPAPAQAAPAQAAPASAGPALADNSVAETLERWEASIRGHFSSLLSAVPRIPEEFARASTIARTDVNSGRPGLVIGILLGLVLFGYAAEYAVSWALSGRSANEQVRAETNAPHQVLVSQLPSLGVFAIATACIFLIFEWPPLLRRIVLTFLVAFIAYRLVMIFARFATAQAVLLRAEDDPPPPPEASEFWRWRVALFAGVFFVGWAFVSVMSRLGFSDGVRELVAYAFGIGLLAIAVEVVWRRPSIEPVSRRKASLLTLYLAFLWLLWVSGLVTLLWLGIYALVLPQAVVGVGRIAQAYVGSITSDGWRGLLTKVMIARGARAAVIVAAALWLWFVSSFSLGAVSGDTVANAIIRGVLNAVIVLLVADLIWNVAKASIGYRLEQASVMAAGDAETQARNARLRTLLPIFRNGLAVFILVVAVLSVLAGLGVQIGPLIAGAGIFGVAIGFGSQTLVKDVLSGVFYMLDDAFRVGEYIQSGSYKGTVESFSLRSVRLRHHRGPIFTVPFGELGAVQNMSRDWVMEKWTINVTYDSDIEKARKIIKRIGQELAEDPEFAASTLQPLKMQGVEEFGEFAIVLKLKLMTRPGEQFSIKRKAFVMIKKAFEENGIRIAVPTVEVSGHSDNDAAVAQQYMRRQKAAQTAAAGS